MSGPPVGRAPATSGHDGEGLTREAFVEALSARHGVSAEAAGRLFDAGDRMRRESRATRRRRAREVAMALDARTGEQVGSIQFGKAGETHVTVAPLLRRMDTGRDYVVAHTHPDRAAPSPEDAQLLLAQRPVRTCVVFGNDGVTYVFSAHSGRGSTLQELEGLLRDWENAEKRLRLQYQARVSAGEDPDALWEEETHELFVLLANRYTMAYERLGRIAVP